MTKERLGNTYDGGGIPQCNAMGGAGRGDGGYSGLSYAVTMMHQEKQIFPRYSQYI